MVRDLEVAEELFQESVLEILSSADKYDPNLDFIPWACGVIRNVVRSHWRKTKKVPSVRSIEILESLSKIVITNEEEDLWKEEKQALHHCLKKLPSKLQKLLHFRYNHNFKGRQLSEQSNIPVGSIRTTLARTRKKLRHCINTQIEQTN